MNKTDFSSLPLSPALVDNLASLGYSRMTPIQAQSLPVILNRQDLIAQAKTGSGKTAAFGLGLLDKINPRWFAVQALVLCPTRELADQVAKEIRRLARCIDNIKVVTLCGGTPMGPQIGSLEHGAHVVVGTPGRLHDHLSRNTLDLSTVETLVLDEADRMVDMGFYEEIVGIVAACPRKRQTLLFSATYPDNIRKQSARFLKNPVEVKVESLHDAGHIEQHFYKIQPERRVATVAALLDHFRPVSTIAFCNTKQQVRELANELQQQGFSALALYGELEQRERDEILVQFANRSCSVLVATDVAARGLDISTLEAVINVDLSHDPEIHIHRIGRTGRGGEKGLALSLVGPNDSKRLALIEDYQQAKPNWADPAELTSSGGPLVPPMVTLCIAAGRKDKVRPGDILGALTGEAGIAGQQVGKISVFEFASYVALDRHIAQQAFSRLAEGRIKGRSFKMRFVGA
ncbi:ATP-dependent RNA helicase DbpA [Pseudogulbenkiania subflava]|uniref:ATP-dependent RNA helicase DbpA n=1 Tax=Pseudogulbenkiania subflava DSM 22618 TaxID=1123014 RepID=A0A1Y6C932_9NEIS|nr:ATP-dependent RNA helicase DbpA [Pseudogulbenkiania subflava]SMF42868.1 ATP-dependent RNA helicase DbpA [Pseudogulbenkiania subflava DSM 22618]